MVVVGCIRKNCSQVLVFAIVIFMTDLSIQSLSPLQTSSSSQCPWQDINLSIQSRSPLQTSSSLQCPWQDKDLSIQILSPLQNPSSPKCQWQDKSLLGSFPQSISSSTSGQASAGSLSSGCPSLASSIPLSEGPSRISYTAGNESQNLRRPYQCYRRYNFNGRSEKQSQ